MPMMPGSIAIKVPIPLVIVLEEEPKEDEELLVVVEE